MHTQVTRKLSVLRQPDGASAIAPWAIVLAGGEGVRLRPLVRQLCGDERPKQFAKIVGSKSLLGHTLDRVGLKIPPSRTVISACRVHDEYLAQEFPETPAERILAQPQDRGTAAGILFPAHWIHSQDPEAVVSIFPADHFILEESAFMRHIVNLAAFVQRQPSRIVLVGAPASTPETEYGWIEPGETFGRIESDRVLQVKRFWEKPSEAQARSCLAAGHLWNTFVIVAKLSTLLDAGRRLLPQLSERLTCATRFLAVGHELPCEQEYALAEKADFSRAILQACPSLLAVSPLPAVTWSDLGTPRMVFQMVQMMEQLAIDSAPDGFRAKRVAAG
jgi:mannose-1-phosphate guanylyltransferase